MKPAVAAATPVKSVWGKLPAPAVAKIGAAAAPAGTDNKTAAPPGGATVPAPPPPALKRQRSNTQRYSDEPFPAGSVTAAAPAAAEGPRPVFGVSSVRDCLLIDCDLPRDVVRIILPYVRDFMSVLICGVSSPSVLTAHDAGCAAYKLHTRATTISGSNTRGPAYATAAENGDELPDSGDSRANDLMIRHPTYRAAYDSTLAETADTDTVGCYDYWSGEMLFTLDGQELFDVLVIPKSSKRVRTWMANLVDPTSNKQPTKCTPEVEEWIKEMTETARVVVSCDSGVHVFDLESGEYLRSMNLNRIRTSTDEAGEFVIRSAEPRHFRKLVADPIAPGKFIFGWSGNELYRMNILNGMVWQNDTYVYAAFPHDRFCPQSGVIRPPIAGAWEDAVSISDSQELKNDIAITELIGFGEYIHSYCTFGRTLEHFNSVAGYIRCLERCENDPSERRITKKMVDYHGTEWFDGSDPDADLRVPPKGPIPADVFVCGAFIDRNAFVVGTRRGWLNRYVIWPRHSNAFPHTSKHVWMGSNPIRPTGERSGISCLIAWPDYELLFAGDENSVVSVWYKRQLFPTATETQAQTPPAADTTATAATAAAATASTVRSELKRAESNTDAPLDPVWSYRSGSSTGAGGVRCLSLTRGEPDTAGRMPMWLAIGCRDRITIIDLVDPQQPHTWKVLADSTVAASPAPSAPSASTRIGAGAGVRVLAPVVAITPYPHVSMCCSYEYTIYDEY